MKDWLNRHILLTREERFLIAGILLIALVGLGARFVNDRGNRQPDSDREVHPANVK